MSYLPAPFMKSSLSLFLQYVSISASSIYSCLFAKITAMHIVAVIPIPIPIRIINSAHLIKPVVIYTNLLFSFFLFGFMLGKPKFIAIPAERAF